jgi:hypothetical protein
MTLNTKLKDCLRWAHKRCHSKGSAPPRVTLRWLHKLWIRQGGRCWLTGVPMEMKGPFSVTLDQIRPSRGYYYDNTALVTRRANLAKGDMTMREFRKVCRQVLRHA